MKKKVIIDETYKDCTAITTAPLHTLSVKLINPNVKAPRWVLSPIKSVVNA
jgi:hypothetical protein